MAFSFGFSEDIGSDDDSPVVPVPATVHSVPSPVATSQVPVRSHTLDDLVGKPKKKVIRHQREKKSHRHLVSLFNKPTTNQLMRKKNS